MKKMKKLLALTLVIMSVLAVAAPALAATTTVNVGWVTVSLDHPGGKAPGIYSLMTTSSTLLKSLSSETTVQIKMNCNSTTWAQCQSGATTGYIQLQWINFTDTTFYNACFGGKALQRGYEGDAVCNLQMFLDKAGYNPGGYDGKFGSGTEVAVKDFQQAQNITKDGIAGSGTAAKLRTKLGM